MEVKVSSDNDLGERTVADIQNNNVPYWSKTNYGVLDSIKENTTDANGTAGVAINEDTKIVDMKENSTAESKVPPAPGGATVYRLPGFQPDYTVNNTFSLALPGSTPLKAPRAFYTSGKDITISYYKDAKDVYQRLGNITEGTSDITVFSVPYGDGQTMSDTIGVNSASQSEKTKKELLDYLTKLNDASINSNKSALQDLLFNKTHVQDLNNLINTGLYSKAYRSGLTLVMGDTRKVGTNSGGTPQTKIPVAGLGPSVYDQFEFISQYIDGEKGTGYYNPSLVKWAKTNKDSIMQVLMVNYMLQSQFKGDKYKGIAAMEYDGWNKNKLPMFKEIKKLGSQSKEPLFLYGTFDGAKMSATIGKGKSIAPLDKTLLHADLSYIYHLYSAIMFEVWQGTDSDGFSEAWKKSLDDFDSNMKGNAVKGEVPKNANRVGLSKDGGPFKDDLVYQNNLAYGLSSYSRGVTVGDQSIYGDKLNLVASLRILFSRGEVGSTPGTFRLNGIAYGVTPITKSKRNEAGKPNITGESSMYQAFSQASGSAYDKYAAMILASDHIAEYPATFNSHWGDGGTEYVFMPATLGGSGFVKSVTEMVNSLTNPKGSTDALDTLSYANRYIILHNFKISSSAMTDNSTGLRLVQAGANIGSARDTSKPIVITGYNGGESFSFNEYLKARDLLSKGREPESTAKTISGGSNQLQHLNLFKDYFTIKSFKDIAGAESNAELKIDEKLVSGYKKAYTGKAGSKVLGWVSPDYKTFFDAPVTR